MTYLKWNVPWSSISVRPATFHSHPQCLRNSTFKIPQSWPKIKCCLRPDPGKEMGYLESQTKHCGYLHTMFCLLQEQGRWEGGSVLSAAVNTHRRLARTGEHWDREEFLCFPKVNLIYSQAGLGPYQESASSTWFPCSHSSLLNVEVCLCSPIWAQRSATGQFSLLLWLHPFVNWKLICDRIDQVLAFIQIQWWRWVGVTDNPQVGIFSQ